MTHQTTSGRRRASFALATAAALALAGAAGTTSYAAGSHGSTTAAPQTAPQREARGFYDVDSSSRQAQVNALRTQAHLAQEPAVRTFRASSPGQTVLDLAGSTGTVRMLTRLDGFLTPASKKSPTRIALGYVRAHHAELGLTAGDLATFHLARDYRDITGAHHLFFTQRIAGKKVIHNGLTASVDRHGRLLTVGGAPVSTAQTAVAADASPRLATAAQALGRVRGTTTAATDLSQDTATSGLYLTPSGLRPAWQTVVMSSAAPAETVLDAQTGQVLMNHPLITYEASHDSTGHVYHYFPGAPRGGRHVRVDFTRHHWLSPSAHILSGNNSHTYSDVNDNNRPSKSEEVHPLTGHSWGYPLKPFHLKFARAFCSNPWPCSWNPNKPFSWRTNRAQNATQVFFFVNNWHDHLQRAPIGFTEAAGNFQKVNRGKAGKAGDAVNTQTDDGANTDHGLPDGAHIDNANMSTPPDGRRPQMQMYLQHEAHTPYSFNGDAFAPTNVGDEADTVYHEYTHGLSGRLNVDVDGASTLGGGQAGAMGEAWSDWYAMDYLVHQHLQKDKRSKADVRLFLYDGLGVNLDRTEPIDCKVGQKAKLCNGAGTGHTGGYTYRDYGKVVGGPEVHGDGEIWAQTLWTLRYQLGSWRSRSLVTRAMELAPYNPSFLDMRNAILVADTSLYAGKDRAVIWKVFAQRGMGFFAGSLGGNDTQPGWSFATPPSHLTTRTVQGTVTDGTTHAPVVGTPVTLAFQGSGTVNPTAITDASGHYVITGVPEGTYTDLAATGRTFQTARKSVTVGASGATVDFSVRRDFAAASSGATISSFNGADFSVFGCGPTGAIDLGGGGWSSNAGPGKSDKPTATFTPKHIVVDMHRQVDVAGFGVDPSSSCGDAPSASTAQYLIQTSPDGTTWTQAATGTFTSADNAQVNDVAPTGGTSAVRYVKFTIESNQVPDFATDCPGGGDDGCRFADLTELEVFGTPTP